MAAIASTRIASGGGVFHKPQANDTGGANGTDASSPFQQLLDTSATGATPVSPPADSQNSQGKDTGKKSGKDAKLDGKTGHTKTGQAQQSQVIAGKTLSQAAAHDDGQDESDTGAVSGKNAEGSGAGQSGDPSLPQSTPDTGQTLAAAQMLVSKQDDGMSGKTDTGDPIGDSLNSGAQKIATPVPNVPSDSNDDDDAASASDVTAATGGTVSKSGKGKHDRSDPAAAQLPGTDTAAQADTAAQSTAPVTKKEQKSGKARDQDNAGTVQTAPSAAAPVVSAASLPLPVDANPDPADATAAAAIGQVKGAAKSGQANSTPPAAANAPASGDPASSGAPKSDSSDGTQASPADASAAQNGGTASSNDTQSSDAKSASAADDKGDKPAAATPAATQPQVQTAQQQQPQPPAVPVGPAAAQPQAQAGTANGVAQNVQLSQADSGANANTVGALAVAIAARSQSGNKQFDIRLDPPELGRVEVRLAIDTTGKVQASLSADQPRTLELLKTDAPQLTRALRDAGLNVSQNGLNFSLRGQNQQNGGSGNFAPRAGRAAQSLIATSAIGSVSGGANYQGPADGRLDIRV